MKKTLILLLALGIGTTFGQIKTYNESSTYINANITTNNAQRITGAILNNAMVNYLLSNQPTLVYDTTRPYQVGQFAVYGYVPYICTTATSGVFADTNWVNLITSDTGIVRTTTNQNIWDTKTFKDTVKFEGVVNGIDLLWESGTGTESTKSIYGDCGAGALRSMAWGEFTTANNTNATAWGAGTVASGQDATAWGGLTKATQPQSTAWGVSTEANGFGSTAWGRSTIANKDFQTVIGKYNETDIDDEIFGVGIGDDITRKTAFSVLTTGDILMQNIPLATTPQQLYYNTTTKAVSYGHNAYGFYYVEDSALTLTPAVQSTFYHVTNPTNNFMLEGDTLNVSMTNDTIKLLVAGKYNIRATITFTGSLTKDYSFRFMNNLACKGKKTMTGNGPNNYITIPIETVCTATANEEFVLQYANISGTEDIIIRDLTITITKID